ncbi:unnamed protein product [Rhizoctonia solani]|uniref:Uncharacterized protein n=1 Tax=Rhizoctonia solani TaxID=456999 RepID=A0A8H3DI84_9AGAM|nr:unnamed protein product [Rhizoctonia solani]
MFFNTNSVLNLGKEIYGMSVEEKVAHCASCEKKKRLFPVVEELIRLDPTLFDRLINTGAAARRAVNSEAQTALSKGQSNGRSEDMRKIGDLLPAIYTWSAPVTDKEQRGLGHNDCAYLLAPVNLEWEDESVRNDFIKGKIRATPHQFPKFCWLDYKYDPTRPSDGLLYSKLLIDCATAILLSSSSVEKESGPQRNLRISGARGRRSARRAAKGLAKRYQIGQVTTAFVAYVVVCVRHTLTDDSDFHQVVNGYNYATLYDNIKTYLEAPSFASRAKVLLNYWNQKIFKDIYLESVVDESAGETGTLASLMAEVEADGNTNGSQRLDDTGNE